MRHSAFWILTTALALLAARHAPCAEPPKLSQTAVEGALREYERLAEKYKIEIVLIAPKFPQNGSITGQPADPQKVATFLAVFKNEWSFYPVELMEPCGLKRVTLCEELFSSGRNVGGVASGDQLFIDVGESRHSKLYSRALIHHEFFHILDLAMHRKVGVRGGLQDTIWEGLNAPGFKYDPGIFGQPGNTKLDLTQKGFLNKYQQTAVHEDKADMYAYMVTMGQIVDNRAKIDPVIAAKVDRMKTLVKAFCPQMDEEFWKAARKVSRTGG